MTRKNKIILFASVVVVGALVWAIWPAQEEGTVRVNYVGVSTNNANAVLFSITNGNRVVSLHTFRSEGAGESSGGMYFMRGLDQPLRLPTATNHSFEYPVPSTNRWKVVALYYPESYDSFMIRLRTRLGNFAASRNCHRIAKRMYPILKLRNAYGPEMLGNEPVAAGEN
jgi:hypothetical protein